MKKKVASLIAIVTFAVAGYFTFTQVSAYSTPSSPVLYTAKEDHFEVRFPNEPTHAVTDVPFQSSGETVRYNSYVAQGEDQTLYLLTTASYPITPEAANVRGHLQIFLKQLIENLSQTVLVRVQENVFQNNPAVDFTLLSKAFWTYGRAILAGNRVFILLSSNANEVIAQKNFRTFANSLVIK